MRIGPEHRVAIADEEVLFPDVLTAPDGRAFVLNRGEVVGELVIDVAPIGRPAEPDLVDLGELRRRLGLD